MKYVIIQYDDRKLSKRLKSFVKINKMYCKYHKYKHIFIDSNKKYGDLPPYWVKVKLVLELMKKYQNSSYSGGVLWLDSDAVIYDINKSLDEFPQSITFAPENGYQVGFNAGVFLFKNTVENINILSEWLNLYNPANWVKLSKKEWKCVNGVWAGESYEQGAFHLLIDKYSLVNIVPHILHCNSNPQIDTFSYHFYTNQYKNDGLYKGFMNDFYIKNHSLLKSKKFKDIGKKIKKYCH